jgi:hypothetical protein
LQPTSSSTLPLVQVALGESSFPVDSLNVFPLASDEELMPWHSSPSEYFDSMNSACAIGELPPPLPEQLWQRHCDITLHDRHRSSSTPTVDLFRPPQPDSLDVACWEAASKWNTNKNNNANSAAATVNNSNVNLTTTTTVTTATTTNKNTPAGLWRVSEHIETILRQISRQTKCDFNN